MQRLSLFLVLLTGLFGLVLTGCQSREGSNLITGDRARQLVGEGALLLDVRTPGEFKRGHIDGATNIPLSVLDNDIAKLDKSRPVVVYCQSGNRSKAARQTLASQGFTVYDLGGLDNW